jgi:hypothetical protein
VEIENILLRPGCQCLGSLFEPGYLDKGEWNDGFFAGAIWALWSAGMISEHEHDCIGELLCAARRKQA